MKVKLFAIYDSVSGIYDGPSACINEQVALRDFKHMAQDDRTKIGRNPEHFSLWVVGAYDDSTGLPSSDGKVCVAYAVDVLKEENDAE